MQNHNLNVAKDYPMPNSPQPGIAGQSGRGASVVRLNFLWCSTKRITNTIAKFILITIIHSNSPSNWKIRFRKVSKTLDFESIGKVEFSLGEVCSIASCWVLSKSFISPLKIIPSFNLNMSLNNCNGK